MYMTKTEQLQKFCKKNNGYLFACEAEDAGISRTFFFRFVKENHFERVAKGIYLSEEEWPDELYILQKRYPTIVYTGMTALYLHTLIDREYTYITAAVPSPFNGSRLRNEGITICQFKPEIYKLGISAATTVFGNIVQVYNRERCICDIIRNRKHIEVQFFQTALKEYMSIKERNLPVLIEYAQKLNMRDEVMKYVEVMT